MISKSKSGSAFTIMELLVAATITILIVVMLGTMLGSITNTSSRANERVDAFRDARAALHLIERDMVALVHATPAAYFALDTDLAGPDCRQIEGVISIKNTPAGKPTPVPGDLCTVRYYCGWNGKAYSLNRYFCDSKLTFQTFAGKVKAGPPPSLGYLDIGPLYKTAGGSDETLAAYAWNLQAVAYDALGNVINSQKDAFGNNTTAPYTCDPNGSTKPLPASIEISFDAISPTAARTLLASTSSPSVWMVADNKNPSRKTRLFINA